MRFAIRFAVTGLTSFLALCGAALAEDAPLRVGRISYTEGAVSFHAADQNEWSFATLNYPVVSGNAFWTDADGRSEVQLDDIAVRMDHLTQMEAVEIDESATRFQLDRGVANIHFSAPPAGGAVEVITPSGAVELSRPGTYHIDSGQPGPDGIPGTVQVSALEGQLEIRTERAVLQVMAGETAVLTGNPPAFSLQEAGATAFDNWALARERREEAHNAANYVSPYMTGYEDLNYYGQWAPDPAYGTVWYPANVQADWAPYRDGRWAFVEPWGWTWVDKAPWGFAPFHYGRWAMIENRWAWVPGERAERPVYAPALVAFAGGKGWNVRLSEGETPAVGWVPLAPHEAFRPYYPASPQYIRKLNVHNADEREIDNAHDNINHINQRGATVVPTNAFEQGRPVHQFFLPQAVPQLSNAPARPSLAHIAPANKPEERSQAHPPAAPVNVHSMLETSRPAQAHVIAAPPPNTPLPETHDRMNPPKQDRLHEQPPFPQRLAEVKNPALPATPAEVPHPHQQAPITPTAQGWQRKPDTQPHNPPAHSQNPQDKGRKEEQK